MAVKIIEEAVQTFCRVKIACADLEISHNTFLNWKSDVRDKRHGAINGPANKLKKEVSDEVIKVANSKEFCDFSPWIIVAKLADQGKYLASESSFYKILKANNLLAHRGKSQERKKKRPLPLIATGPGQIWTWDITYIRSSVSGIYYYLYLFMDIYSRKIVGFDIFASESMQNSSMIFERTCLVEGVISGQLTLHADNGGPMKGATMLATMQKLGVVPSFSRPMVSDDNPYSESLFKTIKYHHTYPGFFNSIEESKRWVISFINWYNEVHFHSGIKFVTPSQRHQGLDVEILEKRKNVYLEAKRKNPERWNGRNIKNFEHKKEVYLNHLQKEKEGAIKMAS